MIKNGDFVAQIHPKEGFHLKTGIVVYSCDDYYEVQWLAYNKSFWDFQDNPAIKQLNNRFLLTKTKHNREDLTPLIKIISKAR